MPYVTVPEAQAQLPMLLAKAEAGEEIVIARNGKPVARIVGYQAPQYDSPPRGVRRSGVLKGKIHIDDDLFAKPLPDEELARWEGSVE